MSIFDSLFKKLEIKLNFLNRDKSPSNKANIKSSPGSLVHQASRDINITNSTKDDVISDLELRILQKLYKRYRKTKEFPRWKATDAYKELDIPEGVGKYVGMLNDSKYVDVDGDELVMTNNGIRYMDNKIRQNRPQVNLASNLGTVGSPKGTFLVFQISNDGKSPAIDIKFSLKSKEFETIQDMIIDRLAPGQSFSMSGYDYTDTDFFKRKLTLPRIVFSYKDNEDNPFHLVRDITQDLRADGNFNIRS